MSTPYDQAAADLPNFPRAVIDLWFEHAFNQGEAWPPRLDAYGIPVSAGWLSVLGDRPFVFWRSVKWTRERLTLTLDRLEPRSARVIVQMLRVFAELAPPVQGVTTRNYRERIRSFLLALQKNEKLPVPPLLLEVGAQYEVLDGNHRLVALFFAPLLQIKTVPTHEGWVARPSP